MKFLIIKHLNTVPSRNAELEIELYADHGHQLIGDCVRRHSHIKHRVPARIQHNDSVMDNISRLPQPAIHYDEACLGNVFWNLEGVT